MKKAETTPTIGIDPKRQAAMQAAIAQIEKTYGEGAIMKLGDNKRVAVEMVPSGSMSLDAAMGGGVPKGRIIEIYGPESSGKTTLALHMVASFQRTGGQAAFIDAEHALDINYAEKIGVDVNNLLLSQPDNGEQALETVETLVRSGAVDVIVIDSVAALTPKAEIEGMMGDSHMGLQARLMSQALRKITAIVSKTKCTVIFLNQIRMKIGVMFGNPETTTGGNALKFYASVRLDVRRSDKILESSGSDKVSGNKVKVKVVKNKVAPPFKTAEFDIMYNEGISREGDILDFGVAIDVITKSGAFYSFTDTKLGQGRENSKTFLRENPKIFIAIEKEIRKQLQV